MQYLETGLACRSPWAQLVLRLQPWSCSGVLVFSAKGNLALLCLSGGAAHCMSLWGLSFPVSSPVHNSTFKILSLLPSPHLTFLPLAVCSLPYVPLCTSYFLSAALTSLWGSDLWLHLGSWAMSNLPHWLASRWSFCSNSSRMGGAELSGHGRRCSRSCTLFTALGCLQKAVITL